MSAGFNRNSNEKDLSVIPVYDENSKNLKSKLDDSLWNDGLRSQEILSDQAGKNHIDFDELKDGPRVMEISSEKKLSNEKIKESDKTINAVRKTADKRIIENDDKDVEILSSINPFKDLLSMKVIDPRNKTEEDFETTSHSSSRFHNVLQASENPLHDGKPTSSPTTRPGVWETRRRLRLSHLSGGGAAAAVAMVAVGAVMLVLGPAVIVLRALDERRQERRFRKLSGRDDLPPTYEQATLMDEAPRYSSLSLNTILGPPPPPSPTPARVHLV